MTEPGDKELEGFRKFLLETYQAEDVQITVRKKPDLIGGFLLRVGCREYDWSLRGRLDVYKRQVIVMLFKDTKQHNKPHVHVYYGEYEASVGLDGELLAGSLPSKQYKILVGWLLYNEEAVYKAWNLAVQGEHFDKIKPM